MQNYSQKNTYSSRQKLSMASSLSLSTKTCACPYDGSVAFLVEEFQENPVHLELKAHTHKLIFLDTDSPDVRHSLPEPTSQQKN
jgi:hypothetical protein